MSALAAYEDALRGGGDCVARGRGGRVVSVPVSRWLDAASESDAALLRQCHGSTLDVGCGPGRLTIALIDRGLQCLGIDVSAEAVRIARQRGAAAIQADVFGEVPEAGQWQHVLLADGNIGIGGEPSRLLGRVAELIRPGGTVVIDLDREPRSTRQRWVHLQTGHGPGGWMPWAHVSVHDIADVASATGLRVVRLLRSNAARPVAVLTRTGHRR